MSQLVSEWVTRSPIELSWIAKNDTQCSDCVWCLSMMTLFIMAIMVVVKMGMIMGMMMIAQNNGMGWLSNWWSLEMGLWIGLDSGPTTFGRARKSPLAQSMQTILEEYTAKDWGWNCCHRSSAVPEELTKTHWQGSRSVVTKWPNKDEEKNKEQRAERKWKMETNFNNC